MKKVVIFLPVLLAFSFFSCKNEGDAYTPTIVTSYFLVNPEYEGEYIISAEDTLQMYAKDDYYVLDSISESDTVVFACGFCSYANDLIAIRINFDTTQLNMDAKLAGIKSVLLPTTDYRNLQLMINPGYNTITLPCGYTALQAGGHKFSLVVESDSKYSPNQITYYQPVR